MFKALFAKGARTLLFGFLFKLGRRLLEELPLPLLSKLADGKLTRHEIQELVVLIGGEAALVFQEYYQDKFGEPEEDEELDA